MLGILKDIKKVSKSTMVINAASAAIANPFKALAGLAVAGAAVGGVLALANRGEKADDFMSPGYGKRAIIIT